MGNSGGAVATVVRSRVYCAKIPLKFRHTHSNLLLPSTSPPPTRASPGLPPMFRDLDVYTNELPKEARVGGNARLDKQLLQYLIFEICYPSDICYTTELSWYLLKQVVLVSFHIAWRETLALRNSVWRSHEGCVCSIVYISLLIEETYKDYADVLIERSQTPQLQLNRLLFVFTR